MKKIYLLFICLLFQITIFMLGYLIILGEEKDFIYDTPEKAKLKNDSIKIRNKNKISSNSLLKNSKISKNFIKVNNNQNNPDNSEEQQEKIKIFLHNYQNAMNNVYDIEFINNLLDKENKLRPIPDFLGNHPTLLPEHRAILIDWMIEICEDLAFKRDTLHYAVNYLDRFLSRTEKIEKNILQLVGVACLSIAGKFEVFILFINKFIYLKLRNI